MPGQACHAHDLRDPGGKHSKRSIPADMTELILAESVMTMVTGSFVRLSDMLVWQRQQAAGGSPA